MANKKVEPSKKKYSLAGCVTLPVLKRIEGEAKSRGVYVSRLIGEIITDWVEQNGGGVYSKVEGQGEMF